MASSKPCDERIARMVEENKGLVFAVLTKIGARSKVPPDVFEEMVQEAMTGLFMAVKTYDESKGAFSTHATWVIRGRISHFIDRNTTQKRKRDREALSLQQKSWTNTENGSTVSLEDMLKSGSDVEAEALAWKMEDLQKIIQKHKSALNWDIFLAYMAGRKQVDIADALGVSRQRVNYQINRAKEIIADELRRIEYGSE